MLSHGEAAALAVGDAADMAFKVLILGGTSDGRQLALRLRRDGRYTAMLSFAGRTQNLEDPGVPYRVGGFGGVAGLVAHLQAEQYQALIDATHPFARQMSEHAVRAAELTSTPLLRIEPPAWVESAGDRWQLVADMAQAAAALGASPRRVFLSIGRLEVEAFLAAPQHEYLIRAVDAFVPPLPRARVLAARGPFQPEAERALFERERIQVLVSKNAGTPATYAKLMAARALALPVIMVERPRLPAAPAASKLQAVLDWLHALHDASGTRRGV
jgi:precorrin-6A/cobalt-precorrin-6A reductase